MLRSLLCFSEMGAKITCVSLKNKIQRPKVHIKPRDIPNIALLIYLWDQSNSEWLSLSRLPTASVTSYATGFCNMDICLMETWTEIQQLISYRPLNAYQIMFSNRYLMFF